MSRSHVFLKVEVECEEHDEPEKIAQELCRGLLKFYAVRSAEVSSVTAAEE